MSKRQLLIGCGHDRRKKVVLPGQEHWEDLWTLDRNPACDPKVLHDLENLPLPFGPEFFDEVHGFEIIEHCTGRQGEAEPLFAFFSEMWRILKPDGLLLATVPLWNSIWAWGDPSHRRIINAGTLVFLNQAEYEKQIAKGNAMSDYRDIYRADFELMSSMEKDTTFAFIVKAIKPSRWKSHA